MPRRPLGTYVRTTADWFLNETFCGTGGLNGTGGPFFASTSLYNADQHGRVIVVDAIDISCPNSGVLVYTGFGVDGSPLSQVTPIVAGNPLGTGQIFNYANNLTPPALYTAATPSLLYRFAAGQLAPMQVRFRGPIAYLKPGYSLGVSTGVKLAVQLQVNFYHTILKE